MKRERLGKEKMKATLNDSVAIAFIVLELTLVSSTIRVNLLLCSVSEKKRGKKDDMITQSHRSYE